MRGALRSMRIALVASFGVLALATVEFGRAGLPAAPPASTLAAHPSEAHQARTRAPTESASVPDLTARIAAASGRAPFTLSREPAPERFTLDGLEGAEAAGEQENRPDLPALRVLGVAHFGDGKGIAALALEGQQPRVLRVGESIAGRTLAAVTVDGARLVGGARPLDLKVPREAGEQ